MWSLWMTRAYAYSFTAVLMGSVRGHPILEGTRRVMVVKYSKRRLVQRIACSQCSDISTALWTTR